MAMEEREREQAPGYAAHDGPGGRTGGGPGPGTGHEPEPLSDLERGTVQRAQLRTRIADIAWTALIVVLGLWALWSAVGIARETENALVYCVVGGVLFTVALWARLSTLKARARTHL
ncbi:hypothetical protein [Streptomyces sp. NPDC059209]|uniref:hypothetical protein n=1 Tax=Streptomyces sp. NPDC059209 TaxID=3346769 RepID=UPI00367B5A6B